jgi:hypothetical protein
MCWYATSKPLYGIFLMFEIVGAHRRLPNSIATVLALAGAIISSVLIGSGVGVPVVVIWFGRTRGDGAAALVIAAIAAGLFASVVMFTFLVSMHHAPARYEVALPAMLWLAAAIRGTWTTCKGPHITLDNWLWILRSSDQRNYELGWIIRGWFVTTVSLVAALIVSQLMLKRGAARAPLVP